MNDFQKNLVFAFVFFLVAYIVIGPFGKGAIKPSYVSIHTPNLKGLESLETTIAPIPKDLVEYLKSSQKYGSYFNSNKKFVIYYTGMDCPYGQTFAAAMNAVANGHVYDKYYNFLAKDAGEMLVSYDDSGDSDKENMLNSLCSAFCIVNPNIREVFSLNGVGPQEGAKISTMLNNLKKW